MIPWESLVLAGLVCGAFVAGFYWGDKLAGNQYNAAEAVTRISADYLAAAEKVSNVGAELAAVRLEVAAAGNQSSGVANQVEKMDRTVKVCLEAFVAAGFIKTARMGGGEGKGQVERGGGLGASTV